ncbi:hypothetical protein, partial [Frankia sp. AvcI1]
GIHCITQQQPQVLR